MMRIAIASVLSVAACGVASAGSVGVPTKPGITEQAQQIAYRRCWWHHGERHCRWSHNGYGLYRYNAGSPEDYRVGTAAWYRAMEREDRLNKGGGRGR
jgi:hypothetical protein